MYVTGSTGKTEDRLKFLTKLDLFKKHNITTLFMQKMEHFTCFQRSIIFQTNNTSGPSF